MAVGGRLELRGDESTEEAAVQRRGVERVGGDIVEHIRNVLYKLERLLLIVQERLKLRADQLGRASDDVTCRY